MELSRLIEATGLRRAVPEPSPDTPVTWIHTTELLDPSLYLSGGELLLTTGLWRRARGSAEQFVRALCDSGVAALGYGLPAPNTSIPSDVVAACTAANLPLLEVPYETPFIAISKIFVERTAATREQWLRNTVARSENYTRAIREGRGPSGIVEILQRAADIPFAVIKANNEVLAYSGADENRLRRAVDRLLRNDVSAGASIPSMDPVFDISAAHPRDGYLIAFPDGPLTDDQRAVIEQAVTYLGVELARQQAIRATELRFVGDIVDMAHAGPARLHELADRLGSLGLNPEARLGVIALEVEHSGPSSLPAALLDASLHRISRPGLVVARGDSHLLLVEESDEFSRLDGAELCREQAARHSLCTSAAIGVGVAPHGARDLHRALAEASNALRVARSRPGYSIVHPEEAASHQMLIALTAPSALNALTKRLISPLRKHDRERGTVLLLTLQEFLAGNGQWQSTANELHIHVNTLRQRIARIEEVTGSNLSEMSSRVDFFLALKADELGTPEDGQA